MEEIPLTLQEETFQQVFEIAEVANLKKEEYMLFQKDVLDRWTEYAVLKTAKEKAISEGMAIGIAKGTAEGMEKGIQKGMAKGRTKGLEEAKSDYIRNLIVKLNFTDQQIADLTEVSIDFIKKIRTSLEKTK
ncbi:flagellar biosynthesis/type III secretory pathway protein FliH [Niabella hirudinis]